MSKADEMFKELGYKLYIDENMNLHFYKYEKIFIDDDIENKIIFYIDGKTVYSNKILSMQELSVINKKIAELGWNKDRKKYMHEYYINVLKPKRRGTVR